MNWKIVRRDWLVIVQLMLALLANLGLITLAIWALCCEVRA